MSTWEERMSERAQVRIRAERERERARIAAEAAAEQAELEERYRPVREAGPPGGCRDCWSWVMHGDWAGWWHGRSVQPGPPPPDLEPGSDLENSPHDWWCWHPCHGDEAPRCCAPVALAAG